MRAPLPCRTRGFTLIELLVVLVVIGIAVSLVMINAGLIREDRPIDKDLQALLGAFSIARDEAALQGRNFGLRIYPGGYAFLDLDADTGVWTTMQGDKLLAATDFDDSVLPTLEVEDREVRLEPPQDAEADDDEEVLLDAFGNPIESAGDVPHVLILSSGEVTPFVLELEELGSDAYRRIEGDFFGELTVQDTR